MSVPSADIFVDPANRLVIRRSIFKVSSPKKGRSEADKSSFGCEASIAEFFAGTKLEKLVLDGKWELSEDNALKLHVFANEPCLGGKVISFRGRIEDVDGDDLVLAVRSSDLVSGGRSFSLNLSGAWQADRNNRIAFYAAKNGPVPDVFTFQGAWTVGKNNELLYRYTSEELKTKDKRLHEVRFRGYWQLGRDRIVYSIEGSSSSRLSFTAALQSKSMIGARGEIKYRIGVSYVLKGTHHDVSDEISVFGEWKLAKDLSSGFEIEYEDGRCRTSRFYIEKLVGSGISVAAALKDESGKSMGFEVVFTKVFKNDAELFLALSRFAEENSITGGFRVRF